MSTLRLTTISNQSGSSSVPSDTVINGSAKAWVNFNGTGVVAIRASFNVSSITDFSTGDYGVNFTNPMVDANYYVGGISGTPAASAGIMHAPANSAANQTTSSVRVASYTGAGAVRDDSYINVAIFR